MRSKEWKFFLEDILNSIDLIKPYTQELSYEGFANDQLRIDGVIRNFIIIGEAACHVPAEIITGHPEIPWSYMRGIRHMVVHEYRRIDLKIIWDTIRDDFPPLVLQLKHLLESES